MGLTDVMDRCSDPGANPATLELYARIYPNLVLANPQLPLIELEDKERHDRIVMLALEGVAADHADVFLDRAMSKGSRDYPWLSCCWLSHTMCCKAFEILPEVSCGTVMANMSGYAQGTVTSVRNPGEKEAREAIDKMLHEFAQWVNVPPLGIEATKLLLLCHATGQTPPDEIGKYAHGWLGSLQAECDDESDEFESDD